MTILIEKTKKIILGLLVAGLAVGLSAFTNSKTLTNAVADRLWVNDGNRYIQMDSADPEANCLKAETEQCALISTDNLEPIPSTIEYEDVVNFASLEAHPKSSKGLYDFE